MIKKNALENAVCNFSATLSRGRRVNTVRPRIWVNIGSGKDLLCDHTKPLPELLLTHH